MSESRGEYLIDVPGPRSVAVTCQGCGVEVARMVEVTGRVFLSVGKLYLVHLDGWCQACGAEYHWTATAQKLDRLIMRMVERRAKDDGR